MTGTWLGRFSQGYFYLELVFVDPMSSLPTIHYCDTETQLRRILNRETKHKNNKQHSYTYHFVTETSLNCEAFMQTRFTISPMETESQGKDFTRSWLLGFLVSMF